MTTLAEHLDRYLAVRRALGYRLEGHSRVLASFVDDLEANGQSSVTVTSALAFASAAATDRRAAAQLSMVRRFAV